MADISSLTNLQSAEPLDWDQYADAKEASPPPPKGRYVVRAPSQFTFGSTAAGFLSAQIDPTVAGPSNEGYTFRFTKVSAKPFKRGAVTVSQLGDYLRAAGSQARPRTPQEQADAVEATAGATFQVDADWEAYDKETKWSLKGMEKFPKLPDGSHEPWITLDGKDGRPESKDPESGEYRRIRANAKVDRYVSAS